MSEREKILGRIREALRELAPVPGTRGGDHAPATLDEAGAAIPKWLPAVGGTFADLVELFRKNADELRTDFRLVESEAELIAQVRAIRDSEGWKKVAFHRGKLTDPVQAALGLPVCDTTGGYDVAELESSDVGISECDALIAQTGTVVVTAVSAGGRALSILPPHHMVIARREQLLPDLPAGFALLKEKYASRYPSFVGLITGPSRTGDIERMLVLGAHGPKRLTVFCL